MLTALRLQRPGWRKSGSADETSPAADSDQPQAADDPPDQAADGRPPS
ncbi:hypothetical protein ACFQD1_06800 [Nonomuraea thailandensis]